MKAFATLRGGGRSGLGALGQHDAVTQSDVVNELEGRGYVLEVVHHAPPVHEHVAPILTKAMAVRVACDEMIRIMNWPATTSRPYRCPRGTCPITSSTWNSAVSWCVTVATGYLSGRYSLPSWAKTALAAGTLQGSFGLSGVAPLGGWLQDNPWFVSSVGDLISNYGEYLNTQQVKDAIEANAPKGALTKDDIPALLAMLTEGGYIPAGKTETVAHGATEATSAMPGWLMPALLAGGVLLVVVMMQKK